LCNLEEEGGFSIQFNPLQIAHHYVDNRCHRDFTPGIGVG
jgi:hypothetical protein